ncbi:MAG: hypothetical protein IPK20_19370 [Betaproteobacteria bacterium]|nr:hypothetical protein [Betaproteobacteria bacterium]
MRQISSVLPGIAALAFSIFSGVTLLLAGAVAEAGPTPLAPVTIFPTPNLGITPDTPVDAVTGKPLAAFGAGGGTAPGRAPGATFHGSFDLLDFGLYWKDWGITSGATGATTNGQYLLLAGAGYAQPTLALADMSVGLSGFAVAADGFAGGEYVSLAAFWTNAHMSAPAFSTWMLPLSAVSSIGPVIEPIRQNAYPYAIPAAVFGPGITGIVGLYVSFNMGPNQRFGGDPLVMKTSEPIVPFPPVIDSPPLPSIPEPRELPLLAVAAAAGWIAFRRGGRDGGRTLR